MEATVNAEELFRTSLAQLGNETKRRLIELLAASLTFGDDKEEEGNMEAPCQYTLEEVRELLKESEQDALLGKGIDQYEAERRIDQYLFPR